MHIQVKSKCQMYSSTIPIYNVGPQLHFDRLQICQKNLADNYNTLFLSISALNFVYSN